VVSDGIRRRLPPRTMDLNSASSDDSKRSDSTAQRASQGLSNRRTEVGLKVTVDVEPQNLPDIVVGGRATTVGREPEKRIGRAASTSSVLQLTPHSSVRPPCPPVLSQENFLRHRRFSHLARTSYKPRRKPFELIQVALCCLRAPIVSPAVGSR
jgi:hypothetical protein